MRGDFHDIDNKFLLDDFFEKVSPIVYGVTGPPDECSDDELPGTCLVMTKGIMKKQRQYLKKKNQNCTESKPSKNRSKVKSPTKRAKRQRNVVATGVDKQLTRSRYKMSTSFSKNQVRKPKRKPKPKSFLIPALTEKSHCNLKSVTHVRRTGNKYFAKSVLIKNNKNLDAIDLSVEKDKDTHRPEATNKSNPKASKKNPKTTKKTSVTKKITSSDKYKVFDYVLVKYPGYGNTGNEELR